MTDTVSANQVIQRMQRNLGVPWVAAGKDKLFAGNPDTRVTGIVTTFAPSLEVLRKAVAGGKNMVIAREAPFWVHELYGGTLDGPGPEVLAKTAAYRAKREFIETHGLVLWRFAQNWDARKTNGQVRGLANALSWARYHQSSVGPGEEQYGAGDVYFRLPRTDLGRLASEIQTRLKLQGVRVIGAPQTTATKVALMPGFTLVPDLRRVLREPGVDVVVAGEPVEWEAGPYFQDVIASGQKKGMILLGQQASAEPGSGEVAAWLRTFVPEIPVEWIPAGEPFWIAA